MTVTALFSLFKAVKKKKKKKATQSYWNICQANRVTLTTLKRD